MRSQIPNPSEPFTPPRRAKAIMVLGTTSHAGKSTIAAGLCRILSRQGPRVAPFKAQNMSLNSFVTPEGGEIGRAQALQARACGIEPHTDMNPILLKPSGGGGMQVVADGKPIANLSAAEYYGRIEEMRILARAAYDRLAARYDIIVLEGAGSPAEINLRDVDIVNASMAEYADARCLLVADIDRGGVFAAILGTVSLLPENHRKLLAGVIINKFRGDVSLLDSGIREIEELTGVPVLGVLPHLGDLELEEEDSLGLEGRASRGSGPIEIAVIRLPFMSNYTDFQPLEAVPGITLRYASRPHDLGNPDLIVLPGSKSVRRDAGFLRASGLDRVLIAAAERRIPLFGICGGFQILGEMIRDPHGLEGEPGESPGLGLLPVETVLEKEKELCRVQAVNLSLPFLAVGEPCSGYEIHMGRTTAKVAGASLFRNIRKQELACSELSGYSLQAGCGLVFGGYLHGLFDSVKIRQALVKWLFERKGLLWNEREPDDPKPADTPLNRLADALQTHLKLGNLP